jgi:hypothetical protein
MPDHPQLVLTETDLNHVYGQSYRRIDVDGSSVVVVADYAGIREYIKDLGPVVLTREQITHLMTGPGATLTVTAEDGRQFQATAVADEPLPEPDYPLDNRWWAAPTAEERGRLLDNMLYGGEA